MRYSIKQPFRAAVRMYLHSSEKTLMTDFIKKKLLQILLGWGKFEICGFAFRDSFFAR